ncbi:L-threonylcarbamoyladenylate synthase [Hyphomicrobium sp.]|jgi:L-threonylcarbamoyladenylate synthase|uniref:L-threonylcarbamoyladenylate synthase n=1 Tax=Hyphomicrobium sp. TaxID=82 RepID=UPI002C3D584C|nr:L-threonylcarbamoyladenylate synthase [Hyphomicrobium sp.]HVZ04158.1 L-threonylcarbamoyladenylate synthase [Hyphomicrobium sp.]
MPGRIVPANDAWIAEAAQMIRAGALVAFPTETVYGLGSDAANGEAVARIFEAKGRPSFNPLIVHVAGLEQAVIIGSFSATARRLTEAFWPGPLTLVVPRLETTDVSDLVSAGLPTVAIRAPDHPIARELLKQANRPIAAPSANRSGHVSATRAEHVAADLGDNATLILNGGPTAHGLESTVLSLVGDTPVLLRPGAVSIETIEQVIGEKIARANEKGEHLTSPGQLRSHYAPHSKLRLNATTWKSDEAVLGFGKVAKHPCRASINLSPSGDLIEAAANLFAALRALDESGADTIAVTPIPTAGLGEAINDRLERAAAPRD